MKKMILLFVGVSFIFMFASCNAVDNPTNSSDATAVENATNIPTDTQAAEDLSEIPDDIEIVYTGGTSDKTLYDDLNQVEDLSTIIVEAVPKKTLGQVVSTTYDPDFGKEVPDYGYTKWEIEVTKVYKGDVKVKDKLVLLHDYYIWTNKDEAKQLISSSSMKPPVKDKKYIMFLQYDDTDKGYWPVCDYEGMFAIPTDKQKAKTKDKKLKQSDLDVYDYEPLQFIVPIYNQVVSKYSD